MPWNTDSRPPAPGKTCRVSSLLLGSEREGIYHDLPCKRKCQDLNPVLQLNPFYHNWSPCPHSIKELRELGQDTTVEGDVCSGRSPSPIWVPQWVLLASLLEPLMALRLVRDQGIMHWANPTWRRFAILSGHVDQCRGQNLNTDRNTDTRTLADTHHSPQPFLQELRGSGTYRAAPGRSTGGR